MTDNEIIKALELCRKNEVHSTCEYCLKCPFSTCDLVGDEENCLDALYRRSINLIKRQKAEIEELKAEIERTRRTVMLALLREEELLRLEREWEWSEYDERCE